MQTLKFFHRATIKSGGVAVGVIAVGLPLALLAAQVNAAKQAQDEIWPGKRFLMVLPVRTSEDFNGDTHLAQAVVDRVQLTWRQALMNTNKFSVTEPFRFDPLLQRALMDKAVTVQAVDALVVSPTVANALPVLNKLDFDQPGMAADIQLEDVRAGGTPRDPNLELQFSGRLYQQGSSAPVRSIVVTSNAVSGRDPQERVEKAAVQVLNEIAHAFVTPEPVDWGGLTPAAKTATPAAPTGGGAPASAPAAPAAPAAAPAPAAEPPATTTPPAAATAPAAADAPAVPVTPAASRAPLRPIGASTG